MIIAVYARKLDEAELNTFRSLQKIALENGVKLVCHKNLEKLLHHNDLEIGIFNTPKQLAHFKPEFFISVGGDGTMLDSILYIRDSGIPVLGINTGRLGFLSNTSPENLGKAISNLINGKFEIEQRTLVETNVMGSTNYHSISLNDVSIHKRDTSAMITIHCHLNGEYFNTYWADGLLVSSPTGSTAYSLSCGGPILFPNAKSLLITPVAPHNLNVRPIIVSDDTEISLEIEGRGSNFLLALDSRNKVVEYQSKISLKKAPFQLSLIKFKDRNFVNTLQDKLNWGKDNRNLNERNTII